MSPSVSEVILHCQKQIKKDRSEDRLLHYIGRLSRLKIGTNDLIETGIGRTINQLSREKGVVGEKAYALVAQWKALVEAERSNSTSEDEAPKIKKEQVSDDDEDEEDERQKRSKSSKSRKLSDDDDEEEEERRRSAKKKSKGRNHSDDERRQECRKLTKSRKLSASSDEDEDEEEQRNSIKRAPKGQTLSDDDDEEDGSSDGSDSPQRRPQFIQDSDDEDETALFIDQHEPEPEPEPEPERKPVVEKLKSIKKEKEPESPRKRRGDSKEREEKAKKPKVEEKTPEKKPDPHECLRPKLAPRLNVEIDSTSGLNFSDVLSGLDAKRLKKSPKKVSPTKKSGSSTSTPTSNGTPEKPLFKGSSSVVSSSSSGREKEKDDNSKRIAKVSPFAYTPPTRPPPSTTTSSNHNHKKVPIEPTKILEELAAEDRYWEDSQVTLNGSYGQYGGDDALATMMSSRNQRTKVYSGAKTGTITKIPTLFKMCLRVVQDNIAVLEDTGGVPFYILEPVLRRITVQQLMQVEHYNPYLIESTDDIWKYHCSQNFRGNQPDEDEDETWRELYYRCVHERTARFESLTSKLKTKLEVATPVRKAKLAYVEANSKSTKFRKSKADAIKTGMSSLKTREEKGPARSHGSSASSGGGGNNSTNIIIEPAAVIISGNGKSRSGGGGGGGSSSSSSAPVREAFAAAKKPRKAPLMQKTLKSMKTLMRR